jgi:peptidyl-prolyl cis-trans isomerase A (cyclophilin A)
MRKLGTLLIAVMFSVVGTAAAQTGTTTKSKTGTASTTKTKTKTPATSSSKTTAAASTATAAKPSEPPQVVFDTPMGQISCVLFPDKAPKTVANFIGLANGTKTWTNPMTAQVNKSKSLYQGTIFHRVIPNFMIQGGDPLGNGTGSPGYSFEDEFSPDLRFDRPGRLAMANSGPNTNGSQFFITEVPTPHLDNLHTIFGQCDDASVEIVKAIARVPADPRDNRPDKPVTIDKITILGVPKPATAKQTTRVPRKPVK